MALLDLVYVYRHLVSVSSRTRSLLIDSIQRAWPRIQLYSGISLDNILTHNMYMVCMKMLSRAVITSVIFKFPMASMLVTTAC